MSKRPAVPSPAPRPAPYYYLVAEELDENIPESYSISVPGLFKSDISEQNQLVLQGIRDIQFSLIAKKDETLNLYLVQTDLKPRDLIMYIREHPDWDPSHRSHYRHRYGDSESDTDSDIVQTIKIFKYRVDPANPSQSGLDLTYYHMEGDRVSEAASDRRDDVGVEESDKYYLCFPTINLPL